MTIHTFEVSTMLTNDNFYSIQDELKNKDKSKWKATKNGMAYWGLSKKGILFYHRRPYFSAIYRKTFTDSRKTTLQIMSAAPFRN